MALTQARAHNIPSGPDKADVWETIREVNHRRQSRQGIRE